MSLRLPPETAQALDALAHVTGRSKNSLVVEAIDRLIEGRRNDKEFLARVRKTIERDREALERLVGS